MKYKSIQLRGSTAADIKTEIMYEVASARVSGIELLGINIEERGDATFEKKQSAAVRILRSMKSAGAIQFFATAQSFEQLSTEAQFLLNKYPDIFEENFSDARVLGAIYIKI